MRDFFIACRSSEIAAACSGLFPESNPAVSFAAINWKEVEFAFNRLFVGPQSVLAPPYASVYLDHEPYTMGETTVSVQRFYQMIGLVSPWKGKLPDDHISLELDACLHMRAGLRKRNSSQLGDIYAYFLNEHLNLWIPDFVKKIIEARETHRLIGWVAQELDNWLAGERLWVEQVSAGSRNNQR